MADSTAPRRVPTEVERTAAAVEAGHAWRQTANSRPGFATWPNTQPGDLSWWRRHGEEPPARPAPTRIEPDPALRELLAVIEEPGTGEPERLPTQAELLAAATPPHLRPDPDQPQPCRGCHACATDEGEVALTDIRVTTELLAAPRRRWWHRLTRRRP